MGETQMRFTLGRRSLATVAVTAVATLGVAGSATAQTTIAPPKAPTSSHSGMFFGGGLFKTVFGILGAVRTQVPTIAAPIISDAVTAKQITQAQADQLTALLSGKKPTDPTTTVKAFGGTGGGMHFGPAMKLAPEQLAVLHKVMAAVLAKLPDIAKPVIDKAVADGDLTQKQADMITKVIGLISSFDPSKFVKPSGDSPTTVTSPVAALEKQVTKKVKKAARKARKHSRKARHAIR
jgi:hypothetical protein